MAQFGRPISDLQNTSITGGFGDIDEISASDSDFLFSADNTITVYECGLTASLSDPLTGDSHTIRYRVAETDGGVLGDGAGNATVTVTVSLRQGATVIATDTTRDGTNAWTSHALTITTGEADNITDYTDLRLYFDIDGTSGGAPAGRRGIGVSWGEFEAPERITEFDESITLTSDNTTIELGEADFLSTLTLTTDNTITDSGGLEFDKSIVLSGGSAIDNILELFINPTLTLTTDNLLSNTETVDFNPTLILSSDNLISDNSINEILASTTETIDIVDTYNVGKEFEDTLILTSDASIDNVEILTSTYNETIILSSLIKLQTGMRKDDLLKLINIAKIIHVGKITS